VEENIVFRMYGSDEEYFGSKIRESIDSDLALVMSVGVPNHSFVKVGRVEIGESVDIVGHTGGLEYTYMRGEASSYRDYKGEIYLQVSSLAFFGNSGGGVFYNGELVGISSVIYGKSPGVMFFSSSFTIEKFLNGLN
jgi:hypothetical protein